LKHFSVLFGIVSGGLAFSPFCCSSFALSSLFFYPLLYYEVHYVPFSQLFFPSLNTSPLLLLSTSFFHLSTQHLFSFSHHRFITTLFPSHNTPFSPLIIVSSPHHFFVFTSSLIIASSPLFFHISTQHLFSFYNEVKDEDTRKTSERKQE
jgi:hypothetical protein